MAAPQPLEAASTRPKAVIFDVLGTMVPVDGVRAAFAQLGIEQSSADVWLYLSQRDGIMATLTGKFVPFKEIARYHMRCILQAAGIPCSNEAADEFWARLQGSAPFPDLGPGVKQLTELNIAVACLTNGERGAALAAYEGAGVAALIDPELQLQVSNAGAWKPDARAYDHAARVLGTKLGAERGEMMVASRHVWDVHGARLAGMQAAFIARSHEPYPPWAEQPTLTCASIAQLAEALAKMER